MVAKAVTTSDLLSLELKISEDQRKIRHDANGKIQEDYYKIDEKLNGYKSDLRLTNQVMDRMQTDIKEIKDLLTDFIKTIPSIYATKEEHKINKAEIEIIKATHSKVITWVIGTVGTILIAFLGLIIKTLWIK